MTSFIGFIPARKGSVRIPNKNLKLINKKPLIYYTIKAATNSRYIEETVVFSDSEKINSYANKFGIKSFYKRPKYLSKKNTSMYETLKYFIKKNDIIKKFDYLVLLQPTSPQRSTKDINNACQMILKDKKADGLVSTFEIKKIRKQYPDKFMIKKGRYLKKISININDKIKKKIYLRNGPAILILKIKAIKKNLYNNKLLNFVMPEKRSVDINTIDDFKKITKNF